MIRMMSALLIVVFGLLMFAQGVLLTLLWARRVRLRWKVKAKARPIGAADDDEFLSSQCGPICRECIREGYPVELCHWLA